VKTSDTHICRESRQNHMMTGAVPYSRFRELFHYLPRADPVRVMVLMLALTGCRLSELNRMTTDGLTGNVLYWRLGKNQQGWRSEPLPAWYISELAEYRATHRSALGRLFGPSAYTLRRYFNRDVRPWLSAPWQRKRAHPGYVGEEPYELQLKGFRKSFGTTVFWREYQHWRDAGVALEFASKRLKHSTTHMTAYHYLQHFEHVEVELWDQFLDAEAAPEAQRRLADYAPAARIRG
jgi:integrase